MISNVHIFITVTVTSVTYLCKNFHLIIDGTVTLMSSSNTKLILNVAIPTCLKNMLHFPLHIKIFMLCKIIIFNNIEVFSLIQFENVFS